MPSHRGSVCIRSFLYVCLTYKLSPSASMVPTMVLAKSEREIKARAENLLVCEEEEEEMRGEGPRWKSGSPLELTARGTQLAIPILAVHCSHSVVSCIHVAASHNLLLCE